jgi:hypothetical protein
MVKHETPEGLDEEWERLEISPEEYADFWLNFWVIADENPDLDYLDIWDILTYEEEEEFADIWLSFWRSLGVIE